MKTSELGTQFIKSFEKVRTSAYKDAVGVWTIGVGRIKHVRPGDICTEEQALAWFAEELSGFEGAVHAYISVPISQHQFDALVPFSTRRSVQSRNAVTPQL